MPDFNGNGAAELAVLQRSVAAGTADRVEIRDSLTGALIRNVGLGATGGAPVQLLVVTDMNGNTTPELAVLRQASSSIVVKDARTGATLSTVSFGQAYAPLEIAMVPDLSGNGRPELALLQRHRTSDMVRIAVADIATRQWLGATYYGYASGVRPDDMAVLADLNGNGVAELVSLGVRVTDSAAIASIRDVFTGSLAGAIRFYP